MRALAQNMRKEAQAKKSKRACLLACPSMRLVLAHAALFDGSFEQTRRSLDLKIGEVGFDGYG